MKIETVNHTDRYSVEQICSLYFMPNSSVSITSAYDDEKKAVVTAAEIDGRQSSALYAAEKENTAEFKNAVKKSAFLALKKLSGADTPWGVLTGIRPTKFFRSLTATHTAEEAERILKEDYWVSDKKIRLVSQTAEQSARLLTKMKKNDVGIYIGIPFCPSRCAYCSFITEASAVYSKYMAEYVTALEKELSAIALSVRELGLNVTSVYIGGGTPPALGEALLEGLISKACDLFGITEKTEFTVEAGRPDATDFSMLKMLSRRGVNRICINPQTMNGDTLKKIGRRHTPEDVLRAFDEARTLGFENINSDIIAGLPGENEEMFLNTLEKMKALLPEELTVHTMYLKRASRISKEGGFTESEKADRMIDLSRAFAEDNGYLPYYMYKQRNTVGNLENTGYAMPGKESLYNACIMEEENAVIGCGAGASTKAVGNGVNRIYNTKDVLEYIKNIEVISKNKREALREYLV